MAANCEESAGRSTLSSSHSFAFTKFTTPKGEKKHKKNNKSEHFPKLSCSKFTTFGDLTPLQNHRIWLQFGAASVCFGDDSYQQGTGLRRILQECGETQLSLPHGFVFNFFRMCQFWHIHGVRVRMKAEAEKRTWMQHLFLVVTTRKKVQSLCRNHAPWPCSVCSSLERSYVPAVLLKRLSIPPACNAELHRLPQCISALGSWTLRKRLWTSAWLQFAVLMMNGFAAQLEQHIFNCWNYIKLHSLNQAMDWISFLSFPKCLKSFRFNWPDRLEMERNALLSTKLPSFNSWDQSGGLNSLFQTCKVKFSTDAWPFQAKALALSMCQEICCLLKLKISKWCSLWWCDSSYEADFGIPKSRKLSGPEWHCYRLI